MRPNCDVGTAPSAPLLFGGSVLLAGVGGLHIPNVPEIAGAESFAGPRFHSAEWDHSVDLAGKKVTSRL